METIENECDRVTSGVWETEGVGSLRPRSSPARFSIVLTEHEPGTGRQQEAKFTYGSRQASVKSTIKVGSNTPFIGSRVHINDEIQGTPSLAFAGNPYCAMH